MIDLKKYEGIKFKVRSFNKDEGLDCLTFVLYFLKQEYNFDFDINKIPEYDGNWYSKKALKTLYIDNIKAHLPNLKLYDRHKDILKEGDIIMFSLYNQKDFITHIGIYVGDGKFIHSVEQLGVVVDKLNDLHKKLLKWVGVING